MGNESNSTSVILNNDSVINSVTATIANTHCIVCGTAFHVSRMGKLYCSSRCKQFGYNHKTKIGQILADRNKGVNAKPTTFLINDYSDYCRIHRMTKRGKELDKKRREWEAVLQEIQLSNEVKKSISDYTWGRYVGNKLTENEEGELYSIEQELEENILDLNLKELSIEQWSFLKTLEANLDKLGFYQFVSSLSKEFMEQLRLKESDTGYNKEYLLIRNKFINHCNLIAEGIIKFEDRK